MIIPLHDQSNEEKFARSAATVALNNFHWQYATLVLFNSTLIYSVDIFLSSYQKNAIVGRGIFYPSFVKTVRQYVVFGTDISDIVHMLTWMKRHQFDNTGTYIVVCQSDIWDICNEAEIVNVLWNYKIINVVLINSRIEKCVSGFTYYQPEDCKTIRPTNLKNWENCLLNGYKHCRNMFPPKMKDLYQCPIIVSTFNQVPYMNISNNTPTGADGDVLRVIAEAMNFSLALMTPRIGYGWGKVVENGTWSGSLADVYYEWANFSMTSPSITLSRFTTFQMSIDYAVVTVAWITHPSEIEPASLKLLRPLQPSVQIALVISFVMVVLFKVFLKSIFLLSLRNERNVRCPYGIALHSWELCMGLPASLLPVNRAVLCLEVYWIWYCLLIRTFYQVYLINALQTDVYSPEFDTIEESIASKYAFGGELALRDYYIDNPLVYEGWRNVESVEIYPLMMKMSQGLKFVLAMNSETTKMFLSSNPNKKLHILPQLIVTSPTTIFFKKYSPIANPLNVILSKLIESGIIQKMYLNHIGKKVIKASVDNYIPINVVHYTGCYIILLTGWVLSSLCFFVEKLINKNKEEYN